MKRRTIEAREQKVINERPAQRALVFAGRTGADGRRGERDAGAMACAGQRPWVYEAVVQAYCVPGVGSGALASVASRRRP